MTPSCICKQPDLKNEGERQYCVKCGWPLRCMATAEGTTANYQCERARGHEGDHIFGSPL